jgi:hypothetical protein
MTDRLALIQQRIEAKRAEDAAVERRRAIDEQIAALFRPAVDEEGSVSERIDGLAKVTVKYGVTRKVDTDSLQENWADLPTSVQSCFRFKAEVKLPNLRELAGPNLARASLFITAKPASPQVVVELL